MRLSDLIVILLFLISKIIQAQSNETRLLYESSGKKHHYYIDKLPSSALLYEVVRNDNPHAGIKYVVLKTETLLQSDNSYSNTNARFIREGNHCLLTLENSKHKKIILDTGKSVNVVYAHLNNAYFMDQYSSMISKLNRAYPISYIFWVEPYHIWEALTNKEIDPTQFKLFTTDFIKDRRNSYVLTQDKNTSVMNYLIQNVLTLDYDILRDSLFLLPIKENNSNQYFRTVINNIAQQKPEYFFLLAEQYPLHRDFIFNSVEENKEVIDGLKRVEGHEKAKQLFLKERKSNKAYIFRLTGTYVLVGGLITWLLISQR